MRSAARAQDSGYYVCEACLNRREQPSITTCLLTRFRLVGLLGLLCLTRCLYVSVRLMGVLLLASPGDCSLLLLLHRCAAAEAAANSISRAFVVALALLLPWVTLALCC